MIHGAAVCLYLTEIAGAVVNVLRAVVSPESLAAVAGEVGLVVDAAAPVAAGVAVRRAQRDAGLAELARVAGKI